MNIEKPQGNLRTSELCPVPDDEFYAALEALPQHLRNKASYTTDEMAEALDAIGASFAPATLRKLRSVSTDGPPFWKVNGSVRYPRDLGLRWGLARRGPLMSSTAKQ